VLSEAAIPAASPGPRPPRLRVALLALALACAAAPAGARASSATREPARAAAAQPTAPAAPQSRAASKPAALVPFASVESAARLDRSRAKVDFFHLANQFESQTNKAYCGPTSAVIVLNALRGGETGVEMPEAPSLLPADVRPLLPPNVDLLFHRYTQQAFFDAAAARVKTRQTVLGIPPSPGASRDAGLQLRQLARILSEAYGLDVGLRVADAKLPDATIRRELVRNLQTEGDYVIVNYLRSAAGQSGGGHISPLGAYDATSDSFLVLDVNPNAHPWAWIPAPALIHAMRTFDTVEDRGYLLVREGQH
jgi:hypothetical protein